MQEEKREDASKAMQLSRHETTEIKADAPSNLNATSPNT